MLLMVEIRRSPVEVGSLLIGSLSQYVQGFIHIPGGAGFLPPTLLQFTL